MRQTRCKVMENGDSEQKPHQSIKAEAEQGTGRKLRPKELDPQGDNFVREGHRGV